MQPKIFIFTGLVISAESGLTTVRGSDGLWNDHSIDDVCNEHTWRHNYALVHDFYNDLRRTLADSEPNQGHHSIANIQKKYGDAVDIVRSEEHTSELQSRGHLVCRLLLEK